MQNLSQSLATKSIVEILQRVNEVPLKWRTAIKNNAGGYVNHIFYWENMAPAQQSSGPTGKLAGDIAATFGGFENFTTAFSNLAATVFGSGYAMLIEDSNGNLSIVPTANQVCC